MPSKTSSGFSAFSLLPFALALSNHSFHSKSTAHKGDICKYK